MPPTPDSEEEVEPRFLIPAGVGDNTEDLERYEYGGFHPVHIGDRFDRGRYRVIQKFGTGGFSTVWLAEDEDEQRWVALKIVAAEDSYPIMAKSALAHSVLHEAPAQGVAQHYRQFTFEGPNGHHLCLVLPALGPSAAILSHSLKSRLRPQLARKVAYQATRAVAELHSRGLCHGDVTAGNLLLAISNIDLYEEDDIYPLVGWPTTRTLRTKSGEAHGPEAPHYIVKNIDFLSTKYHAVKPETTLVDFDQCFRSSSPPQNVLGTPIDSLAPEVAIGLAASPASDVWALGCCIFRLRSGEGPFSNSFEVLTPEDLINYMVHTLGEDIPRRWHEMTLWDASGNPTTDAREGKPHEQWWEGDRRSLQQMVYNIWDEPRGRVVHTPNPTPARKPRQAENRPFPSHLQDIAWNPRAVRIDNNYLSSDDDWPSTLPLLPKISTDEAALLYGLLTKIFVYDPTRRITAREMLDHPWFHLDDPSEGA